MRDGVSCLSQLKLFSTSGAESCFYVRTSQGRAAKGTTDTLAWLLNAVVVGVRPLLLAWGYAVFHVAVMLMFYLQQGCAQMGPSSVQVQETYNRPSASLSPRYFFKSNGRSMNQRAKARHCMLSNDFSWYFVVPVPNTV